MVHNRCNGNPLEGLAFRDAKPYFMRYEFCRGFIYSIVTVTGPLQRQVSLRSISILFYQSYIYVILNLELILLLSNVLCLHDHIHDVILQCINSSLMCNYCSFTCHEPAHVLKRKTVKCNYVCFANLVKQISRGLPKVNSCNPNTTLQLDVFAALK